MRRLTNPKKFALLSGSALLGLVVVARGSAAISDINTVSTLNGHPPVLTSPIRSSLIQGLPLADSTEQQTYAAASVSAVLSGQQSVQSVLADVLGEERHMCAALTNDCGIIPAPPVAPAASVTVDGAPIGSVSLANAAGAAEVSSLVQGQVVDWTTAYERGVANSVMHQLLWLQAQQDGRAVDAEAAKSYAQQQLSMYLNDTSPNRPTIASGETPQEVFTSAKAIAADRYHLSVNAEMIAIATQAFGTGYTPTQEDTAVLRWFASVLPSHQVLVGGLPAFDLATVVTPVH